jgi:hypothetical protein
MNTPSTDAGPGFLAFVAFFVLALALWFLMRNMNARMRRMSYRQQAAHRAKDDPQAVEGDVPVPGSARVDEADGPAPDAGRPDGSPGGSPPPSGPGR